jgi:hypothetical protein
MVTQMSKKIDWDLVVYRLLIAGILMWMFFLLLLLGDFFVWTFSGHKYG